MTKKTKSKKLCPNSGCVNNFDIPYPLTDDVQKNLMNRFIHHSPKSDQGNRYISIRASLECIAEHIVQLTPPGREQALAITKLEEAMFWANAAIARNE